MKIDDLLRFMVKQEASDLHIKPMRPPLVRVKGKLLPLKTDALPPDLIEEMFHDMLSERNREILENRLAIDFGYSLPGVSRFRASVFYQRGTMAGVFRRVPFDFPSLEDWGMPPVLDEFAKIPQGLVLITGPTGSGKSSTLAALMRKIADTRLVHIVTIEDPIEFLFKDNLGAVTQREIGTDTPTFADALRNSLRQDPDVIMVGEMRDQDTMNTVLQAAETGHLVFSTLHTNSAAQTLDRIVDTFPEGQHRQIRQQIAQVLQAVVSLRLVERSDGSGMIAAVEILRHTPRVAKLIQEGNLEALQEEIENSVSYFNMQTMNQSLAAMVVNGAITWEAALDASIHPGDLDLMLRKLLYASENDEAEEGTAMAEPLSDFSKILELQEIKKLHDESQERHRQELAARDEEIQRLREELHDAGQATSMESDEIKELRTEKERLANQLLVLRQDYEAKIDRLQARLKDLTSSGGPTSRAVGDERKGFFRR